MKIRGRHESATEIGSDKLGVGDQGLHQRRSAQVRLAEIGSLQLRIIQVGPGQIQAAQVFAAQIDEGLERLINHDALRRNL